MSESFYPSISSLLNTDYIPESLSFVKDALSSVSNALYYKNLQFHDTGAEGYYEMDIIPKNQEMFEMDLFGTGLKLIVNPDNNVSNGSTSIHVSFSYSLPVLKIIMDFSVQNFSWQGQALLDLFKKAFYIPDNQLLAIAVRLFEGGETLVEISAFVDKVNTFYSLSGADAIPYPAQGTYQTMIEELLAAITEAGITDSFENSVSIQDIIEDLYLDISHSDFLDNLKSLCYAVLQQPLMDYIKYLLTPHIDGSINIALGLAFPRTWLIPVDENGNPLAEPQKSIVSFNVGNLLFSTDDGISFADDVSGSLNKSEIGNTGLTVSFTSAKLNLSRTSTIPEAIAAGYSDNFTGVFVEEAIIGLPQKWFGNTASLHLTGRNILIGTGGFSGTIGLEAADTAWINMSGNGFRAGFNSFDIVFRQNEIIESNIRAKLEIPKFKDDSSQPLQIDVTGSIAHDGDFNLTASMLSSIRASLFDFVNFDFHTFELGREDNMVYAGTSCDIWFPENSVMRQIIGSQKISIPRLRIYSSGRIELSGGTAFIPAGVNLYLGPVNVSVTGINLGSHQGMYMGKMRQYAYIGFDGAISIDPLGIDARGEGLKYYYTVDNDEHPEDGGDSFIHIQTLEVDLIIPGTASPASAVALIHGMLSIPNPGGEPEEYRGEISLKLPKLNIAAGADMRLMPKDPAFIVNADVQLPAPVPIGFLTIYGFNALLGYRYVAEKEAVGLVSGVNSWYDYYKYPPRGVHISKFSPPNKTKDYGEPFSIGAGAVLGTGFDNGKVLSARVMMLLSLPSLIMIDGKAALLSTRIDLDSSKEPPFFAFVAWGDNVIEASLGADLKIPQNSGAIFSLYANIESKFPLRGGAWYINAGTRDKPVSATLFPSLLNLNTHAYLMLSSQGMAIGAGTGFNLNKSFFGIKVRLSVKVEIGGLISFERPQLGGYLYFCGGISVNVWRLIYVSANLSIYLSAEAPAPFKIYASLSVKGKIKVLFFRIRFNIKVSLSWEANKRVDTTPICPLPASGSENRTKELVQAVHMLTNETYELDFFPTLPANAGNIGKLVPIDSYIEIKSVKGLIGKVSDKIGGATIPPANYMDKIPPVATVKGKSLRQVTHEYSMEQMEIFAWDSQDSRWVAYHPFEALVEEGAERDRVKNLKIGSWQLINRQYDTVRLLATSPFSYSDAGEPDWVTPEYQGITGELLFCESRVEMKVLNFLNINVKTGVYRYNESNHHYINGAWFNLAEEYQGETNWQNSGIELNTFAIKYNQGQPNGFDKSLYFLSNNRLLIMLPENSVDVRLLLKTCADYVTIRYYKSYIPDDSTQVQYQQVSSVYASSESLASSEIRYFDPENPITRIIIEPPHLNLEEIEATEKQIQALLAQVYGHSSGTLTFTKEEKELYTALVYQLEKLHFTVCSGTNGDMCCTTSLQQMRWLSAESYQYSTLIPSMADRQQDQLSMLKAVNTFIQPVWRPHTKYCIHFKLQDNVRYNGQRTPQAYDYYFGFETSGSVGHYRGNNIGEGLNLLEKYIDFNRSYPDAGGNLLQSKPLFWGHYECKINIFFSKPFACHLLNNWPEYGNLKELGGSLNIKIKDPVSEELIPYPLPEDIDVACAEGSGENGSVWITDSNPPSPLFVQIINNLLENNENIPCEIYIDELKPAAMSYSVRLTNLKPLKLYTALLYSAFNPDGTELSDEHNAEIHRFVFQTSRYANFEEQVNSCILKDGTGNERKAIFELLTNMPAQSENDVYQTVWNTGGNIFSDLYLRYSHDFDRLIEGIFRFKPLEAAATTEFNIIRNQTTGNVIAVLVRNPEPFNDPKIPLEHIADTIVVTDTNNNVDTAFKTLYSKDYSQAVITKNGNPITENNLPVRFQYKLWNGSEYNLEKTVQIEININR